MVFNLFAMVFSLFAKATIIKNGHHQSIDVLIGTAMAIVWREVILPGESVIVCPGNIMPMNRVGIGFWVRLAPGGIVENYTPMDINLLLSSKFVLGYAEHHMIVTQISTANNPFAEMWAIVQIKVAVRKLRNMFRGVRIHPVDE